MSKPAHYLDLYDIADRTGLALNSVRQYHKMALTNRASGTPKPGDFPAPDALIGSRDQYAKPGWKPATIDTWLDNRPRAQRRT